MPSRKRGTKPTGWVIVLPRGRGLDDELAVRLSYFLWSSLPDEELFRLARERRLREPAVLAGQVARLLAYPKSDELVQGFARQWLRVDERGRFKLDQQIYPELHATAMAGIDRDRPGRAVEPSSGRSCNATSPWTVSSIATG